MRRAAGMSIFVVAAVLSLHAPTYAAPSATTIFGQAVTVHAVRGGGGGGGHFRGGGHHRGGGHFRGSFGFGVGLGWPWWGYPYPYYYYPPPPVIIRQGPVEYYDGADEDEDEPGYYWYYCSESKKLYPYVRECPGGWEKVLPAPPGEEGE